MSSITAVKHEDLLKRAEECERLGRENSLPVLWAMLAPICIWHGTHPGRQDSPKELPRSRPASRLGKRAAASSAIPTLKAFLAEGMALTGDLDNALRVIDEADRPNRTPRVGGTPSLRRDPAPQGLDALAQGRP